MVPSSLLFLSTLPARGATRIAAFLHPKSAISIHAPREGSDAIYPGVGKYDIPISIHAPREGSDGGHGYPRPRRPAISIHAPREGSDSSRLVSRVWPG